MDRRAARLATLALLVATALAGAAVGISRLAPGTVSTFRSAPLLLDYPASWRVFRYPVVASFFSLHGYIATFPIPDPCTRTTGTISCGVGGYELPENTVVLTILSWSTPWGNILTAPDGDVVALRIHGLPAWRRDLGRDRHTGADRAIEWSIARPDSLNNWVTIKAQMRGPDIEPLERQVDAVIASIRWEPPVVPIDRGPIGRLGASAALGRYLESAAGSDPTYSCFLAADGERVSEIDHVPGGMPVTEAAHVTCSTELAPTDFELWTATLTMRWGGDGERAGRWQVVLYINGAGDVIGSATTQADELPGPVVPSRDSHP